MNLEHQNYLIPNEDANAFNVTLDEDFKDATYSRKEGAFWTRFEVNATAVELRRLEVWEPLS